jgi:hypothetical protein
MLDKEKVLWYHTSRCLRATFTSGFQGESDGEEGVRHARRKVIQISPNCPPKYSSSSLSRKECFKKHCLQEEGVLLFLSQKECVSIVPQPCHRTGGGTTAFRVLRVPAFFVAFRSIVFNFCINCGATGKTALTTQDKAWKEEGAEYHMLS